MRPVLFENSERQHANSLRLLNGLDEVRTRQLFPLCWQGRLTPNRSCDQHRQQCNPPAHESLLAIPCHHNPSCAALYPIYIVRGSKFMATVIAARPATATEHVPWYLWCAGLAVTSVTIGAHWDVSWHRSIGRDSFWTPAHMAIYLCGILAGICSGYLILTTTVLRPAKMVASSVRVFGFRGPLGAFLAAWGGIAMLTSAPFDDWWHNAYGLDVKILSPPHMVLAAGMIAVHLGALILILGRMNRAQGAERVRLRALYLYVGGMILVCLTVLLMELTFRSLMHTV